MRALAPLALALAACASAAPTVTSAPPRPRAADDDRRVAVRADAGVASAEAAWLVAHLADDPDPSHRGESDAVRRLARMGAPGVRVVAEVFRHGEAARMPYARRVLERVALDRCRRERPRAVRLVAWLQRGDAGRDVPLHEGFVWWGEDDTRWAPAAVERLLRWTDEGMDCPALPPPAAAADGGAG